MIIAAIAAIATYIYVPRYTYKKLCIAKLYLVYSLWLTCIATHTCTHTNAHT